MAIDNYADGVSYEILMKRAFQTPDNNKPGIHLSNMKNLIDRENGESWVKHLSSAEKQLEKVKGYMDKGLVKFAKSTKDPILKKAIITLQTRISQARHSGDLMDVVNDALELTPPS